MMQFNTLFSQLKNLRPRRGIVSRHTPLTKDDFMIRGVIVVTLLLLFLAALDGYLFYTTFWKAREIVLPVRRKAFFVSEDIDEVLKLLNERGQKFDELLKKK